MALPGVISYCKVTGLLAVAAGQVWKSTALYRVMRAVNIAATLAR